MGSGTNVKARRHGFARLGMLWLLGCLTAGGLLLAKGMAESPPQPRVQTKAIEQVKVGDWVLAKDPNKAGPPTAHKVLALPRNWTEHVVHVQVAGGGEVQSTRMHPFWVQGAGWTRAKDLKPGDCLLDENNGLVQVSSVRIEDRITGTFNLTVEGVHTYYVMAGETPVLVHNAPIFGNIDSDGQMSFDWAGRIEVHGNSLASARTTSLYRLQSSSGEFLKWGVTDKCPIENRYSSSFLADKEMKLIDTGSRSKMLTAERFLVETRPGPLNLEDWAGKRAGEPVRLTIGGIPCP